MWVAMVCPGVMFITRGWSKDLKFAERKLCLALPVLVAATPPLDVVFLIGGVVVVSFSS
jgi:hypothetical protein